MGIDIFVSQIIDFFTGFYHSTFFFIIRFIILIYVIVLFVDIIIIIILRDPLSDLRKNFRGVDVPRVSRSQWKNIKKHLTASDGREYKIAVLQAEDIVERMLHGIGIKGNNLTEMIASLQPGQIPYIAELTEAHEIRNKIIIDSHFELNQKTARETIEKYEIFLKEMEFLD